MYMYSLLEVLHYCIMYFAFIYFSINGSGFYKSYRYVFMELEYGDASLIELLTPDVGLAWEITGFGTEIITLKLKICAVEYISFLRPIARIANKLCS